MTEQKKKLTLNLLLAYVVWVTFKNAEVLLRPVSASREMFAFYSLEWLFWAVSAFAVIGGLALAYGILRKKGWGYPLGFVWLGVDLTTTLFGGLVSLLNKPLAADALTKMAVSRGRDEEYVNSIGNLVNSSTYDLTMIATTAVFALVAVFFLWQLYKRKEYFKESISA